MWELALPEEPGVDRPFFDTFQSGFDALSEHFPLCATVPMWKYLDDPGLAVVTRVYDDHTPPVTCKYMYMNSEQFQSAWTAMGTSRFSVYS